MIEMTEKLQREHGVNIAEAEDGSFVVSDRDNRFVVRITANLVADPDTLDRAMELAAIKIVLGRMGLWEDVNGH
jgi:hypothetical protein